jgi:SAM-dependent methyltransferase
MKMNGYGFVPAIFDLLTLRRVSLICIFRFSGQATMTNELKAGSVRSENFPDIEWNWENAEYLAEWHEPIYRAMSRFVDPGLTVLEVGAGASHTLAALSGRIKCRAYGLEPDDSGIQKTIQMSALENASVEMVKGNGFTLPFDDETFDVVYSLGLIEHFESEASVSLLREHSRVCKPEGRVIVSVPNSLNLPHTIRKMYLGDRYEFAPERSYSPSGLKRAMKRAGISVIDVDGVEPLWGLAMSGFGWKICRALDITGIAKRLKDIRSSWVRSRIGYMTYAVGRKTK